MTRESHRLEPKVIALAICLLGFALLAYRLDDKTLWGDELYQVRAIQGDARSIVVSVANEGYPPLYFLCAWALHRLAGDSEFALRFPSVIFAVLSIATLFAVATAMSNKTIGLTAMCVMSMSPFFILYSRMAKYYTLMLLLCLMSYFFFNRLFEGPSTRARWLGYLVTSVLAMYTHYLAAFVLLAQGLVALARIRHQRRFFLSFLASQVILLLLFAPWLSVMAGQAIRLGSAPDLFATTQPAIWLVSMVYPVFSWIAGSTIYPWNPVAVVGFAAGLWLICRGLLWTARGTDNDTIRESLHEETAQPELGAAEHPSLSGAALGQSLWAPQRLGVLAFIVFPWFLTIVTVRLFTSGEPLPANRTIVCVPFIYLLIARGISTHALSAGRLLVATMLSVLFGVSVTNYYLGREFHNPNYDLPTKAVARAVGEDAEPADVFISDQMTGFDYYIAKWYPPATHFLAHSPHAARTHVQEQASARVWVILLCRAVETQSRATTELVPWLLQEGYSLDLEIGYGPLDESYSRVEELILRRPSCAYKILVYRYVRLR